MGCAPCAAKLAAKNSQWEWTQTTVDDVTGESTTLSVVYPTEAAAKTKVRKRGGSYRRLPTPVV
jgi:hypothetical protein